MRNVLNILKPFYPVLVGIGILLLVLNFKKLYAKIKLWSGVGSYENSDNWESPDFHLLSVKIYDAFHGSWFTEKESTVIGIVNSLRSVQDFNKLVYQYAKDYNLDLKAEIIKYFRQSQLSQLKYK